MLTAAVLRLIPFVANYLRTTIHPWRLLVDQHPLLYYGGAAVLCVSLMGILQSLVLVSRSRKALAWIPASAFALFVSYFLASLVEQYAFRRFHLPVGWLALAIILGLTYGVLTALPLEWIQRQEVVIPIAMGGGGSHQRAE
jgi:hypothetical protein